MGEVARGCAGYAPIGAYAIVGDCHTDFFHWLTRTQRADPTGVLRTLYTVDGGADLREVELRGLQGYRCSTPVRVGNAAAGQRQLDIHGDVLTAAYLHFQAAEPGSPARREGPSPETWALLRRLVDQAAEHWREPDNGIWEVRGGRQEFLHSRLMCWAALDRGIRIAREYSLPAPLGTWERARAAIRKAILERGYNAQSGAFTQAFGSPALDASALAVPLVGFLPPTDPRVVSTVERVRADLSRRGLIHRYHTPDGLPGGEGAFALCNFWLVDALALGGRLDEAHDLFERVVSYANDVGLMSEEIDPVTGELLGNFPQGFTHLALIRAAVNLAKAARHGPEERPETEAERALKARRAAAVGYSAWRRDRRAA